MWTGYYYANSIEFGRWWPQVKDAVNLYMDWEEGTRWPDLTGKRAWVDLGMYGAAKETEAYVRGIVRKLKDHWGKIIDLEMRDEPKWNHDRLTEMVQLVKRVVASEGLPARPVSATFGYQSLMAKNPVWLGAGLGSIGFEGYIDYVPGESPRRAQARVRARIMEQVARIGTSVPKMTLVCQAYDRNGTWKDIETLVAIQQPTFEVARSLQAQGRLMALALFSWARQGGSQDHRELAVEHRRLLGKQTS